MNDILSKCNLCPRNCGVNRHETIGVCDAGDNIKLAYYSLHRWEEPAIFFSTELVYTMQRKSAITKHLGDCAEWRYYGKNSKLHH